MRGSRTVFENTSSSPLPGVADSHEACSQNVFCQTALEQFLLIPQGSRLVGKYDSKLSVGQTRVLMAWERIIFQAGRSIDLSGMEGVDLEGYAGFHDLVDNH
ncbi:MAG: TrbI/VirB10 family protein [Leptospirillum sp.]